MALNKFFNIAENGDLFISGLGLLFGALITLLSIKGILHQFIIGIFLIFVCAIHIYLRNNYQNKPDIKLIHIKNTIYFDLVFIILYVLSIFDYLINPFSRNFIYFILIVTMAVLVYVEIMNYKLNINKIIIKITLLAVNVQAGIMYLFPSIIGYDAYYHTKIVDYISFVGHMPPIEDSGQYLFSPILHIYVSLLSYITNGNSKDSLFISIGIISVIISILFYFTIKHFINIKAGLISILIFNLINVTIVNDIANITPGSFVLMIYFIMLYFIFVRIEYRYFILPFLTILILLTHQLTPFVVILSFIIIYLIKKFYSTVIKIDDDIPINFYFVLFLLISIYLSWNITYINTTTTFFDSIFVPFTNMLLSNFRFDPNILIAGKNIENYSSLDYNILQISYLLPSILAIGGSLLWLKSKELKKIAISITFLTMYGISYMIPLLGFNNFLTDRWQPFIYFFAMFLLTIYFLNFINKVNKAKLNLFISSIFLFLLIFTSITSPMVNKDNPLLEKNVTVRNQFKQGEIVPLNYLKINYDGLMIMDNTYFNCYRLYGFNATQFYYDQESRVSYFNTNLLNIKNVDASNNLIIFRTVLLNNPIEIVSNNTIIYGKFDTGMYDNFKLNNLLYNNQEIMLFHK